MSSKFFLTLLLTFCFLKTIYGQTGSLKKKLEEKDIREVFHKIFSPRKPFNDNLEDTNYSKKYYSIVPAIGYTLQTGFAGIISSNVAFYNDPVKDAKISTITASLTYSQYQQIIVPFQANIWSKRNRYNYITDIRFISYPSDIYGLGGRVDPNQGVTINFSGIKVHQTVMKAVLANLLVGLGIYYDNYWSIETIDQVSRLENLIINKRLGKSETADGLAVRTIWDSRLNQINPKQGLYASLTYRTNYQALGSQHNSQVLQLDARTYFHFPANSNNVLAFWNFDWLVTGGIDPYLLLPSTGWDDNYNTGRGYIQGRFRGKQMYYGEGEYRFGVTRNGLIGGVVFFNLQTFSGELSKSYTALFPGYGLGLRVKVNKHSGTNLCLDYGFGDKGSKGFFVNLGEVF